MTRSSPPVQMSKRTRELQQSEIGNGTSTSNTASSNAAASNDSLVLPTVLESFEDPHLHSYHRPRAGTMPSSVLHLGSKALDHQQDGDDLHHRYLTSHKHVTTLASGLSKAPGSISMPVSGTTTPSTDQAYPLGSLLAAAAAAGSSTGSPPSRLRSGSLNLPAPPSQPTTAAMSKAFSSSVFSNSAWSPSTQSPQAPAALADEIVARPAANIAGNDSSVGTLDYLGLEGGDISPVGVRGSPWTPAGSAAPTSAAAVHIEDQQQHAPSMHRINSTGSAGPALGGGGTPSSSLNPSSKLLDHVIRNRSNTIGVLSRPRNVSMSIAGAAPPITASLSMTAGSSPLASPNYSRMAPHHDPAANSTFVETDYFPTASSSSSSPSEQHRRQQSVQHLTSDGHLSLSDSVRARAATISALEHTRDQLLFADSLGGDRSVIDATGSRRRAGTVPQQQYPQHNHTLSIDSNTSGTGWADSGSHLQQDPSAVARSMEGLSISHASGGGLSWNGSSRPLTPEGTVNMFPPLQTPTRSLWIGNLDPMTTPADVQRVFGMFGPIESLRILPEKECAFVNYYSTLDAVKAKEEVLDRLGGQLAKPGSSMLRIGFGKESNAAVGGANLSAASSHKMFASNSTNSATMDAHQAMPTRALWVGSIPPDVTPNVLLNIFAPFGPIESARVLAHKSCGFVNFDKLQDAVMARTTLNGKELLGPEIGPIKIGFAKAPPKAIVPLPSDADANINPVLSVQGASFVPAGSEVSGGVAYSLPNTRYQISVPPVVPVPVSAGGSSSNPSAYSNTSADPQVNLLSPAPLAFLANGPESPTARIETVLPNADGFKKWATELCGADDPDLDKYVEDLSRPRQKMEYFHSIPMSLLNDPVMARRYAQNDANRLKELRRRLEVELSQEEADAIAYDLLDECVPLSSDYIGNTVVQKLFERCSLTARVAMLERISPHLAAIGTHKNGTWAAQKMIQCAQTEREYELISKALQPYTPPLLLNDFGNYVVQGTQRFGRHAEYIYDAIVDKIWEIGSGRFGARSTRQTLESPHTPKFHLLRVAIAILSNAIPLASNANGALLITWYLETSNLPGRYRTLAPQFIPHLVSLCTNKLASVSILKMINQRADTMASRLLVKSIFSSESKTLQDILSDSGHGTTCIAKILQSSFLDANERAELVQRVKSELESMRVSTNPAYRKILEEVGLVSPSLTSSTSPQQGPTRSSPSSHSHRSGGPRSASHHGYSPSPPPLPYHFSNDYSSFAAPPGASYYSSASAYPYSPSLTYAYGHTPPPMNGATSPPGTATSPNPISALHVNASTHIPFNPAFHPLQHFSHEQQQQHQRPSPSMHAQYHQQQPQFRP